MIEQILVIFSCCQNFCIAPQPTQYIGDAYFSEMNTKYISLSVLKTSEYSRVRSTSENSYVFNSQDEIYLVFTEKSKFFFVSYTFHRLHAIPHQ